MADQPRDVAKTSWWKRFGTGFVTGAADDDPSGVATYSQVGAKFGYAMLWVVLLTTPLMIAIQMVSARIGRVCGAGLADALIANFPKSAVWTLIALLVAANTINIGADLAAMGAAAKLLIGGPSLLYALLFAVASTTLQVYLSFERYSPVLKVIALSLFAYVATAFSVQVPWGTALQYFIVPHVQWSTGYLTGVVAVLGTTISPYLFCWQAAEEVAELHENHGRKLLRDTGRKADAELRRIALDTTVGMTFSNLVAFFMIVTAAAVLHAHGKTNIQSASDAAEALRPIAGRFAFTVFSLGIISTGLLAVPIVAGASAFAVAGAARKPYGLSRKPRQAKLFYGVLVGSMVLGTALTFSPIDPIKALYWSAVVNGVCAVPLMAAMMVVVRRKKTMGEHVVRGWLLFWGWLATAVMGVAAVVMFATLGKP